MNNKLLGFVMIFLLGVHSIYPLTRTQVFKRAAIAAGIVSGVVYWASFPSYRLEWPLKKSDNADNEGYWDWSVSENAKTPLVNAGAMFLISCPLFAWLASYYTAESRYDWAKEQFKELDENRLYRVTVTDLNIGMVLQESGCEAKELPLVEAFLKLQSFDHTLVSISEELEKAVIDTDNLELRKKLEKLINRVYIDLPRIRNNEAVVKGNDKTAWFEQWKLHQKQELAREKIRQHYPVRPHAHVVYHYN